MARVQSVGGIATLQRLPKELAEEQDPSVAEGSTSIHVRLYAKTDMGLLAIDPRPQSYGAAIPREALKRGEDYAQIGLVVAPEFHFEELGEGRTQGPWHGVIEELKSSFEIETDPETLQALPFELIFDRELAEEFDR
jgi:hypothetical protein